MSCPRRFQCPTCKDVLIHQNNRGLNESSSGFGQHIHDEYPCIFDVCDTDMIVHKSQYRLLRWIEQKPVDQDVRPSQRRILPFFAMMIKLLANQFRKLDPQSGVFIVWSNPPYSVASIAQVLARWTYEIGPIETFDSERFTKFKTGELL